MEDETLARHRVGQNLSAVSHQYLLRYAASGVRLRRCYLMGSMVSGDDLRGRRPAGDTCRARREARAAHGVLARQYPASRRGVLGGDTRAGRLAARPYWPRDQALLAAPSGSAADQSRTTAAVHDCRAEPSAAPVSGSKYSANVPAVAIWSSESRRSSSARLPQPSRLSERHSSQLITGQTGPRQ